MADLDHLQQYKSDTDAIAANWKRAADILTVSFHSLCLRKHHL
jgi:hypothetical protein